MINATLTNPVSPSSSLLKTPLWRLAAADEPGSPFSGEVTTPRVTCTELNTDEVIRIKEGLDAVDYQGTGQLRWKDLMLLDETVAGYRFSGEQFKAIDAKGMGVVALTDILKTWFPMMPARDVYRYCASHLTAEEVFHLKTAFDRITNQEGRMTMNHLHLAGYSIIGMRFSTRMYRTHAVNAAGLSFDQVLSALFPRIPSDLIARYIRTEIAEEEIALLKSDFDAVATSDGVVTSHDLTASLVVSHGQAKPLGGLPFDLRTFNMIDAPKLGRVIFPDVLKAFYPSISPFDLQSYAHTYLTNTFQAAPAFGTASITAIANHPSSPRLPTIPKATPRSGRSAAQFNRSFPCSTQFVSNEQVEAAASAAVHRHTDPRAKSPWSPDSFKGSLILPKRSLSPLSAGSLLAAPYAPQPPPTTADRPPSADPRLLEEKDAEIRSLRAQVENLKAQLARQLTLAPDADSHHLFDYEGDYDANGFIYYIATRGGANAWVNPYWACGMDVDGPVLPGVDTSVILDRPNRPGGGGPSKGLPMFASAQERWLVVDICSNLQPTYYSLAQLPIAPAFGECYMVSWQLHGSKDKGEWVSLSEHTDDTALCGPGATHTWRVRSREAYRYFRITVNKILLMGRDSGNPYNDVARETLCPFHGFEIYGYAPKPQAPKGTALGVLYKASRDVL